MSLEHSCILISTIPFFLSVLVTLNLHQLIKALWYHNSTVKWLFSSKDPFLHTDCNMAPDSHSNTQWSGLVRSVSGAHPSPVSISFFRVEIFKITQPYYNTWVVLFLIRNHVYLINSVVTFDVLKGNEGCCFCFVLLFFKNSLSSFIFYLKVLFIKCCLDCYPIVRCWRPFLEYCTHTLIMRTRKLNVFVRRLHPLYR